MYIPTHTHTYMYLMFTLIIMFSNKNTFIDDHIYILLIY